MSAGDGSWYGRGMHYSLSPSLCCLRPMFEAVVSPPLGLFQWPQASVQYTLDDLIA